MAPKPIVEDQTAESTNDVLSASELQNKGQKIITRRTLYAAGAGLIPFPVIDIATIFGIQTFMIKDLAELYGVDFKEEQTRAFITALLGDLAAAGVVSGIKAIPGLGTIVGAFSGALTGAAATYALGKVFMQHFDQGGTLLNFNPLESRKFFQEAYEEGKLFVKDLEQTEGEIGEKKGWRKIFGFSNANQETVKGLEALREENQQLRNMIADLQKSVNALKKS